MSTARRKYRLDKEDLDRADIKYITAPVDLFKHKTGRLYYEFMIKDELERIV
jgi:hypothetical protein